MLKPSYLLILVAVLLALRVYLGSAIPQEVDIDADAEDEYSEVFEIIGNK
jgi:hypothetical protein